jgi:transcriptional regulator with XRE-family HTH domain
MTPRKLLKLIRYVGEMSQVQVAQATGIPQSTISKIECGKVADVKNKSFNALLTLYQEVLSKQDTSHLMRLQLMTQK